jgi:hypothetical protein
MWNCECECGNEVAIQSIHLRSGMTRSCGCFRREALKELRTTHGMSDTRFYRIWSAMWNRCRNTNDKFYEIYGGKGISVCDEWKSFDVFKDDMLEEYETHVEEHGENNTFIDRVEGSGNYEPSNCRWATNEQQSRNTSSKSGHKGVQRSSDGKKWVANISVNYKLIYLGIYEDLEEAMKARKEAEKIYWR